MVDYSLYLVTDRDILNGRDLNTAVEEAIKGGVSLVQLREKDATSLEFYEIAKSLKEVTDKYNVPLLINDRIDIALAIDAAGVHLGQSDIPAKEARRVLGKDKIIGVTAKTVELAKKAEADGADYLGVGAIFGTSTKKDAVSITLDRLKEIKSSVNIPVVAIGGISSNNVSKLKGTNIDGIAVVSGILKEENILEGTKNLLSQVKLL